MISCEKVEEILVDYADGQLSPGQSSEVAEHLAGCPNCREILEALDKSLDLANIIWADEMAVPIRRRTAKRRWLGYVAAAAAAIVVVTTLVFRSAPTRPVEKEPTFAEIERSINNAASAARLLATAELLTEYPEAERIMKSQYRYIADMYPETAAAAKAKARIE